MSAQKSKSPPARKQPQDPVPERLAALRARMEEKGCEALLILSPENRRYFSGFLAPDAGISESSGALLVTAKRAVLLTDSRFTTQAEGEAPCFETVTYRRGLPESLGKLGDMPKALCFEPGIVTVELHGRLAGALSGTRLEAVPFQPGEFRLVKTDEELKLVRKAASITDQALGLLWGELEPGVPEGWAAFFLETKFRELGGDGPAFPSIVAAGPNAALPHAEPGRKKIGKSEGVVIDIGARYRGYCSDMTRTFMPEKPAGWQKDIYRTVREAQLLALGVIKAGVTGGEADSAARDHISARGYGDYFGHSLGHGVGLMVHEEPRLTPGAARPLPAGTLVTVEPGIYLPGKGGVRLEELVLVTEKGCEILNRDDHFYEY
ncbi:MAG: Xaa-Pro peptidase family protein [Deltaproteobacteria bacterium]|jgi:Xaa-Pro aminopeptidase|nr:Xaa-Pro peptidase family protein [Deltaproteobacteria bacterium]